MKRLLCIFLLAFGSPSFAEIYTWVDENGKKHFSDQPPQSVADEAEKVELKRGNTFISDVPEFSYQSSASTNSITNEDGATRRSAPAPKKLSASEQCKADIARYEASYECFNKCRNKGGGINRAKCPECENVVRPACYDK